MSVEVRRELVDVNRESVEGTSSAPALILRIMLGAPKTQRYVGQNINLIAGWATGAIVV